jgi:xylulokinase
MSLLGIDVGTTGSKAAVFSTDGRCLCRAYREYPTLYPQHNHAELDMRQVWAAARDMIRELAASSSADPIAALSLSTLGEAGTPVSADRQILGNAILASDHRGTEYVETLARAVGRERWFAINANLLAAGYTLPKLMWIRDHQPELFDRTYKFLLADGLITYMLGCEPCISYTHASRTLLFDVRKQDWSDVLLTAAGIPRDKLPRCAPSGTIAGTVADSRADALGLPHGVKVVVGAHDQCCNALGAGIYEAGRAVDGMGTFECITPVYSGIPDADRMQANRLNVEHHLIPGLYVSFIFNQAGSLVRWFRDTFAAEIRHEADVYMRLDAEMPVDPTRLLVLPYFEPSGAPGYIGDASGVITGLRTSTTRGEILKAIMECVTFYFAEPLASLRTADVATTELVATGGGARSNFWLQMKADILGVPLIRPMNIDCSLTGAVMLAGMSTGIYTSPREAADVFFHMDRRFEPDARRHEIYRERIARYQELFRLTYDFLRAG